MDVVGERKGAMRASAGHDDHWKTERPQQYSRNQCGQALTGCGEVERECVCVRERERERERDSKTQHNGGGKQLKQQAGQRRDGEHGQLLLCGRQCQLTGAASVVLLDLQLHTLITRTRPYCPRLAVDASRWTPKHGCSSSSHMSDNP